MASQAEIQAQIDEIVAGGKYRANEMRPLLTSMLDFASAGQTVVFDGLVANDTTMADTTLVLEYGVNIVVTSTPTDYACRLPQPVTGRRVVIINRSLMTISLFPSMAGGRINNYPIDTPAIIPPDGNAYDFICIENPLPGAWTWSAPAIAQYDSGEITTNTLGFNGIISVASPSFLVQTTAYSSTNAWGYDGLSFPLLPLVLLNNTTVPRYVAFKPSTGWNAITKVKVYTNLAYDPTGNDAQFGITSGSGYSSYDSTGAFVAQTPGFGFWSGFYNGGVTATNCDNVVPGATLPYGTLTTNVGDPGTAWGEITYTSYNPLGSRVGNFYEGLDVNGNDYYFTQMINFCINSRQTLTGFKFRFFIEYV
jgi:hypothetical protein